MHYAHFLIDFYMPITVMPDTPNPQPASRNIINADFICNTLTYCFH